MIDIRADMEAAAEHLAGKPILLRFKFPPTMGVKGECYRTKNLTLIDIAPQLGIEKSYAIFLHETAHAKLHVKDVNPTPEHLLAAGAIQPGPQPAFIQSVISQSEAEANVLALRWDYWAESFVQTEPNPEARIIGKITALKYYKE